MTKSNPRHLPISAVRSQASAHPNSWRIAFVAVAMLGLASQAFAATTYTVTDLTKVGISALGMSNTGVVVGGTSTSAAGTMFNSASGTLTDISVPSAGAANFANPTRINASGQILGSSRVIVSSRVQHVYSTLRNADGTAVQALVLPTDAITYGVDINDSGQMLMTNNLPVCNPGVTCDFTNQKLYSYPYYIWTAAGGAKALPKIGYAGRVTSINNAGQISGYTSGLPGDPEHAVVMTQTTVKDLHTKSMGLRSFAYKINNSGYAVGSAIALGGYLDQAVSWNTSTGVATNHGTANTLSQLSDINSAGQFVGWQDPTTSVLAASHASSAMVGNVNGVGLTNLNTLVTGLPANLRLYNAFDINDAGQILAAAYDVTTGIEYGILLLTPNTPPPTICSGSGTITNYPISKVFLQLTDGTKVGFTATAAGTTFTGGTTTFVNGEIITYVGNLDAATTICYATSMTVAPASVTPPSNTAPAAPSALVSSAVTRSLVTLSWTDNASNELNFLVERCKGTGCSSYSLVATVGANVTMYTNSGLRRNTNYSYRVRAINASGQSAYSNTLNVTTLP